MTYKQSYFIEHMAAHLGLGDLEEQTGGALTEAMRENFDGRIVQDWSDAIFHPDPLPVLADMLHGRPSTRRGGQVFRIAAESKTDQVTLVVDPNLVGSAAERILALRYFDNEEKAGERWGCTELKWLLTRRVPTPEGWEDYTDALTMVLAATPAVNLRDA